MPWGPWFCGRAIDVGEGVKPPWPLELAAAPEEVEGWLATTLV